jgi:hypothetical protein
MKVDATRPFYFHLTEQKPKGGFLLSRSCFSASWRIRRAKQVSNRDDCNLARNLASFYGMRGQFILANYG